MSESLLKLSDADQLRDSAPLGKGSGSPLLEVRSDNRAERLIQLGIMLAIGGAAAAGSFNHTHDVAAAHGQEGWKAWADAVVLELMSVASGLEIKRRRKRGDGIYFPATVMAVAVILSLGAQVVDAEQSIIGWIAAAIPAIGFMVMVKIAFDASESSSDDEALIAAAPAEGLPVAYGRSETPRAEGIDNPIAAHDIDTARGGASDAGRIDPVVTVLVPKALEAARALRSDGRRVTRNALAEALRAKGYGVSNERASDLLTHVKVEFQADVMGSGVPGVRTTRRSSPTL